MKIGITWNRSGVYLWGFSEQKILDDIIPVVKVAAPNVKLTNVESCLTCFRLSKLSGLDEGVGQVLLNSFAIKGWNVCDEPSSSGPIWKWGIFLEKE